VPHDTIVGLSSPPGPAPRALIRLSGPEARAIVDRMSAGPGRLRLPDGGSIRAEAVIMRAPRSYTREDVVELHLSGAPPLAAAVLQGAVDAGARPAGPGEFTLRAFLNGRLDLVQAEAVAGVIEAQDRGEVRAALRVLSGQLSTPLRQVEQTLLDLCAEVEAAIDFVDQDIQIVAPAAIRAGVEAAHARLADLRAAVHERRPPGSRRRVILFGPPNAGKTSLFNALTGGSQAITSPRPGTTRDLLVAPCIAGDVEFELWDSPGLFEESRAVDRLAMERSLEIVRTADLVLLVAGLDDWRAALPWIGRIPPDTRTVRVLNKRDLDGDVGQARVALGDTVEVSALHPATLEPLRVAMSTALSGAGDGGFAVTARQMAALCTAEAALERARSSPAEMEILAADLRDALQALCALTGRDVTEDVLGRIFERFCIGK
jgi:tRNA modification GTPase